MISGLPQISGLKGRYWMARATSDVQEVIRKLLGRELPIQVVHNASGRGRDAVVRYSVRMVSTSDSTEIRTKFGSFFVGGQDRRPDSLRSISISNKITPGTQVRIMILKLLAKRYRTSNPGSTVKVIGFESRPILKITPPEDASDRRVKSFSYMEAIQKLPTQFTESELEPILAKARVHFQGALRSTFVVLNDDAPRRQRQRPAQSTTSGVASSSGAPENPDEDNDDSEQIEQIEQI